MCDCTLQSFPVHKHRPELPNSTVPVRGISHSGAEGREKIMPLKILAVFLVPYSEVTAPWTLDLEKRPGRRAGGAGGQVLPARWRERDNLARSCEPVQWRKKFTRPRETHRPVGHVLTQGPAQTSKLRMAFLYCIRALPKLKLINMALERLLLIQISAVRRKSNLRACVLCSRPVAQVFTWPFCFELRRCSPLRRCHVLPTLEVFRRSSNALPALGVFTVHCSLRIAGRSELT